MKMNKKSLLRNEDGVAILMVMAAIALMTFLLVDFTFETKLNKIKAYNQIEKDQARMNAEAGLTFAMAKLKLYQEGRNYIEKTEALKGVVNPSDIESIVTMPFVFPIPANLGKDLQAKTAIQEFSKSAILQGTLALTISPVSGFLNPNNMRVKKKKEGEEENKDEDSGDESDDKKKIAPQAYIENKLVETFTKAFNDKKEADDEFDDLYGNLEPKLLIKELKYFVNSPDNFVDSEKAEIEQIYSKAEVIPKHAPMTSIDEMYLLQGWSDELVELIKDRLATHEVTIIPVNKLTEDQLEILFPNITDEQKEEFFKHRDGDSETGDPPKNFKNAGEFKALIVGTLGVVTDKVYEERAKEFENAGLKIGVAGKLYKVESIGEYNRARYRLVAFVDLPIRPVPVKKKKDKDKDPSNKELDPDADPDAEPNDDDKDPDKDKEKDKAPPLQLMNPRVVEIRLN
jgi:hypothetical protein